MDSCLLNNGIYNHSEKIKITSQEQPTLPYNDTFKDINVILPTIPSLVDSVILLFSLKQNNNFAVRQAFARFCHGFFWSEENVVLN